eukprot:358373-Chlamydomonas_euryale.AAC.2
MAHLMAHHIYAALRDTCHKRSTRLALLPARAVTAQKAGAARLGPVQPVVLPVRHAGHGTGSSTRPQAIGLLCGAGGSRAAVGRAFRGRAGPSYQSCGLVAWPPATAVDSGERASVCAFALDAMEHDRKALWARTAGWAAGSQRRDPRVARAGSCSRGRGRGGKLLGCGGFGRRLLTTLAQLARWAAWQTSAQTTRSSAAAPANYWPNGPMPGRPTVPATRRRGHEACRQQAPQLSPTFQGGFFFPLRPQVLPLGCVSGEGERWAGGDGCFSRVGGLISSGACARVGGLQSPECGTHGGRARAG